MTINLKGDKLVITFRYDTDIIAAIKTITGRKFDVGKKHWTVPVENVVECLDILSPLGLTATLEVRKAYEEQQKQIKAASEIKETPAEYEGNLPLFEFQKTGVKFLKTMPSVLLADAPGLGKTIQTIAALESLDGKILVLCPNSLKYSWAEELKKWGSSEILVIDGPPGKRLLQWSDMSKKYTIANYELLLHDFEKIPKEWDVIVCDEATRISNPSAKTTKALKSLIAHKRIALTGTPISNSPNDIYSIIDWVCPHYLGSYWNFLEKYCVREPRFNRIVGYKNLPELGDKVGRFMLRRTKEEVLTDLPPKIIEDVPFELSIKERKLYDSIKRMILSELSQLKIDRSTLPLIPVKMLRLKQVVDHPSLISKDVKECSKLDTLKDLLKPVISSGDKAIIFTQFAEMAKILKTELKSYNPRMIIGEVDALDRQKAVDMFRDDDLCRVMIMTEAGAYGLNLQVASYVIHYDAPWSIAKLMQREDRAHRIGQQKSVTVYNLIAKNSIDEYVAKVLHKKQRISVDILKDDERLEDMGITEEDINEILRI